MDNELKKRKPNRLKNFDYGQNGAYFITICTQHHKCILSNIFVGDGLPVPKLTKCGKVVSKLIDNIPEKYNNVFVDKFVIMPNHIHMILKISKNIGTDDPSPTISNVIAWLKYTATKQINACCNTPGNRIFQRSYHDHIIRNEHDYLEIWQYIENNPIKWQEDKFFNGN